MKLGIVVGCDQKQEWLLEWWWEHYRAKNKYPVAFIDFGMSERGAGWCRSKGVYLELPSEPFQVLPVSKEKKKKWEATTGIGMWHQRSGWLKKPIACQHSPFEISCWIDLDCDVRGNLEPLFAVLSKDFDIALLPESEQVQKKDRYHGYTFEDEISYNSGVILFRKGAEIINQWVKANREQNHLFRGDQNSLSRMIYLYEPPLLALDPIYNWNLSQGENPEAQIIHYVGACKLAILQRLHPGIDIFS